MTTRKSAGKGEGKTAAPETPSLQPRTAAGFNGIKVFSATMVADRSSLGETVTAWISAHPEFQIIEIVQTQSSDDAFHCIAITVFYSEPIGARGDVSSIPGGTL